MSSMDLSDNKVRLEQLKNLKNLVEINLSNNQIHLIPQGLSLEDFPMLEQLNLAYNYIHQVPSLQALCCLKKLKVLDLNANGILQLPTEFASLNQLEELNLTDNDLGLNKQDPKSQHLLKTLGSIPHLKRVNLTRNKLSALSTDSFSLVTDF